MQRCPRRRWGTGNDVVTPCGQRGTPQPRQADMRSALREYAPWAVATARGGWGRTPDKMSSPRAGRPTGNAQNTTGTPMHWGTCAQRGSAP